MQQLCVHFRDLNLECGLRTGRHMLGKRNASPQMLDKMSVIYRGYLHGSEYKMVDLKLNQVSF